LRVDKLTFEPRRPSVGGKMLVTEALAEIK
jgi:hypothetical protein